MTVQEKYLIEHGWKEVPADFGKTCWQSPSIVGKTLYFDLDAAYELETDGIGIHAYASDMMLADHWRSMDVQRMQDREADHIRQGGPPHGEYPNW
jgi:hypothetical protein